MSKNILLAIDPSLTASGWAAFSILGGQPVALGVISPPGPRVLLSKRLNALQEKVEKLLDNLQMSSGDVLVCEGPAPLVLNPLSALKVERVRSIFETIARVKKIHVPGRLNPRTVQTELLGMRGKQLERKSVKACACEVALRLYGPTLLKLKLNGEAIRSHKDLPQDVIDAVLVGSLALARIQIARNGGIDLDELFASKNGQGTTSYRNSSIGWTEAQLRMAQK